MLLSYSIQIEQQQQHIGGSHQTNPVEDLTLSSQEMCPMSGGGNHLCFTREKKWVMGIGCVICEDSIRTSTCMICSISNDLGKNAYKYQNIPTDMKCLGNVRLVEKKRKTTNQYSTSLALYKLPFDVYYCHPPIGSSQTCPNLRFIMTRSPLPFDPMETK